MSHRYSVFFKERPRHREITFASKEAWYSTVSLGKEPEEFQAYLVIQLKNPFFSKVSLTKNRKDDKQYILYKGFCLRVFRKRFQTLLILKAACYGRQLGRNGNRRFFLSIYTRAASGGLPPGLAEPLNQSPHIPVLSVLP